MSIEESKIPLIELPHRYQGLQSHLLFPAKDPPGNDLLTHLLPERFDPKFPCARVLEKMGAKSGDSVVFVAVFSIQNMKGLKKELDG